MKIYIVMQQVKSLIVHSFIHSFIHLFSVNLITRYGKSHISNSKSYSQLSSMYTWSRDEIVIVIIEIL